MTETTFECVICLNTFQKGSDTEAISELETLWPGTPVEECLHSL